MSGGSSLGDTAQRRMPPPLSPSAQPAAAVATAHQQSQQQPGAGGAPWADQADAPRSGRRLHGDETPLGAPPSDGSYGNGLYGNGNLYDGGASSYGGEPPGTANCASPTASISNGQLDSSGGGAAAGSAAAGGAGGAASASRAPRATNQREHEERPVGRAVDAGPEQPIEVRGAMSSNEPR